MMMFWSLKLEGVQTKKLWYSWPAFNEPAPGAER